MVKDFSAKIRQLADEANKKLPYKEGRYQAQTRRRRMGKGRQLEMLMEPGNIGSLRTRNRIIKTAAGTGYSENGHPTERMNDFYAGLAKGGAGLVIVENCGVEWPRGTHVIPTGFRFHNDSCIPLHSRLVDAVHKHDCPVFVQFMHAGPWLAKLPGLGPQERITASTIREDEYPADEWVPGKELTIPEIHDVVDIFAKGAERAKKAGYDGVEVNGSFYHLINCFLSRFWNRRLDEYGCQTMENRTRFYCDIIREVKRRCGADYPVATNINATEFGLKNGIILDEAKGFGPYLEKAGADLLQVRVTGYDGYLELLLPETILYPEAPKGLDLRELDVSRGGKGILLNMAAAIKQTVSIPVACAGRLDPELGDESIRQGKIDFVGMTRRLIADHDLPKKVAAGRLDDITPCPGCGYCVETRKGDGPQKCRVNPASGREREYEITPAEKKKKVLVAGGGPAAMEAARVAALRGHDVTLYEKGGQLGGLIPMAAVVKDHEQESLVNLVRYFQTQLSKLGVTVKLGQEVDPALVDRIKPDVLILATGGKNGALEIPGMDNPKVVDSGALHRKLKLAMKLFGPKLLERLTKVTMPIGKKVVIVGGGMQGCQLAEFLVKRGRAVTIVDTAEVLGTGLPYLTPVRLFNWFKEKGVASLPGVTYERITDQGLVVITKEGQRKTLEADSIVMALSLEPDAAIAKIFDGKAPEVFQIGDSREFGFMHGAIADGAKIGRMI
jgi:2,4-dienoyl-CoA reductase (NADPH2)